MCKERSFQSANRSVGVAQQKHLVRSRIDDGSDIFGFSLQSVVGGITARSVATTVHRTNREARFE